MDPLQDHPLKERWERREAPKKSREDESRSDGADPLVDLGF